MARTLRLSWSGSPAATRRPSLIPHKKIGENVHTIPPDVVSRQLQAAPDVCVRLLALVALVVTSVELLTGEL